MSLKYIFFNFAQLKLSVAYDINFAADKISCQDLCLWPNYLL